MKIIQSEVRTGKKWVQGLCRIPGDTGDWEPKCFKMTCQRDPHRLIQQFQHFAEFLLLIFVPTDPNARYAMCVWLRYVTASCTGSEYGLGNACYAPLEYVTHTHALRNGVVEHP